MAGTGGACYCVPLPGESQWARSAAVEWTRVGGASSHMGSGGIDTTKRRRTGPRHVQLWPNSQNIPEDTFCMDVGYRERGFPKCP